MRSIALFALWAAVSPGAAHAQSTTQTYSYDVHGRLVAVTTGTGGSTYTYDNAHNRISRSQSAPGGGAMAATQPLARETAPAPRKPSPIAVAWARLQSLFGRSRAQ